MATVMQANKNTAFLSCVECKGLSSKFIINLAIENMKGRPGAVMRAISLSHQVVDSKQPLRRFLREKGLSRFIPSQDPTHMWEPLALGLPPIYVRD